MIVKRNLNPVRVAQYTAGPMAWAAVWAVAVPVVYELTDSPHLVLPFAPIAALGGALAIFVAFRNNTAFARWNEARSAWQNVLVATRVLGRQVLASAHNAVASGTVDEAAAHEFSREQLHRMAALGHILMGSVRPATDWTRVGALVGADEVAQLQAAVNPVNEALARQGVRIKDGIRQGVLGQFDPISLEPQLSALNTAAGVIERIHRTPTPRQYEYFTRRFIGLFAALVPFAVLGLVPGSLWWTPPLALALSGVFIVMAVTGSVNEEPFANRNTDVPVLSLSIAIERELRSLLGEHDLPDEVVPVDGYLW